MKTQAPQIGSVLLPLLLPLAAAATAHPSTSRATCKAAVLPHEIVGKSAASHATFESWSAQHLRCELVMDAAADALANDKPYPFGRDKLFAYVKENNPEIKLSRRQIDIWLKKQEIHQVHYRKKPLREIKSVVVDEPRKIIQLDIADLGNLAKNDIRYLLVAIDMSSRRIYLETMKSRKDENIVGRWSPSRIDNVFAKEKEMKAKQNKLAKQEFEVGDKVRIYEPNDKFPSKLPNLVKLSNQILTNEPNP